MVVYAELKIPADGFVIGQAFSSLPDVQVELERVVPTVDTVVPFVWVRGADPDDVIQVTRAHGAVEHIAVLDEYEAQGTLFRIVWRRAFRDAIVAIAESDMTLLSATGTAEEWQFELRAPSNAPLAEFQHWLHSEGVPLTILRLTNTELKREQQQYGLTASQHEALRLAYERGYFNEPHETTLETLATELGISRQSFGGRLRRGFQNLVASTLMDEPK
ncbi:hypothetical protein BG842_19270 [Haladaptatus sp. W1]|uniref:helix-turn-helix domain-containing protein n=1 Tax=Haladaptatus sp. W1 TaxID=1897478 RepID=UPI000849E4BA|nr:helix-turn-helix domain-containing protein [Haladaptatus sp. W1]ODR83566.1 hypothetical protein BG842_19270 [Haladaptatus sp. W1]